MHPVIVHLAFKTLRDAEEPQSTEMFGATKDSAQMPNEGAKSTIYH
jgi:hypothetical protein